VIKGGTIVARNSRTTELLTRPRPIGRVSL